MERTQVLELMSTLKLYGMRSAYDEVMGKARAQRWHPRSPAAKKYREFKGCFLSF
jgi:hypothetical protein